MKIQGLAPPGQLIQGQQSTNKPGNFGALLKQYTEQVNQEKKAASMAAVNLAENGVGNVAETLIAAKKADLSFQLMLSARNKLVDAYREVIRMQV